MEKKIAAQLEELQKKNPNSEVQLWAEDEHRIGLKPIYRRVWVAWSEVPTAQIKWQYKWIWVYGFVCPESGATYWWLLPKVNTKIFGTILFKRGRLKGLRHVISPNFGFNYTPDYTNPDWGYFKSVRTDLRSEEEVLYDVFETNRLSGFGRPSSAGKQMTFNYSFGNQFEAKIYSRKAKKDKIVKLFRTVNISGNYNFAADSLNSMC